MSPHSLSCVACILRGLYLAWPVSCVAWYLAWPPYLLRGLYLACVACILRGPASDRSHGVCLVHHGLGQRCGPARSLLSKQPNVNKNSRSTSECRQGLAGRSIRPLQLDFQFRLVSLDLQLELPLHLVCDGE